MGTIEGAIKHESTQSFPTRVFGNAVWVRGRKHGGRPVSRWPVLRIFGDGLVDGVGRLRMAYRLPHGNFADEIL